MWRYFFKLALISLRQTPIMSGLMIGAIGMGIAACMTTSTIYYMMSKNPLQHKDDVLFAVQLDSWGPSRSSPGPHEMPAQVTYQDGKAMIDSGIPTHGVVMYRSIFIVRPEHRSMRPFQTASRVTSNDFFQLFDVPFLYGEAWNDAIDEIPEFVVVLSTALNNKIFNGENSVGRKLNLDDKIFTVMGVTDDWHPRPKVHDLTNGAYQGRDTMYVPLSAGISLKKEEAGNSSNWKRESTMTFSEKLTSERVWLQLWVQLDTKKQVDEFNQFIEAYILQQKKYGRFERPIKYLLNQPSEWLKGNKVVKKDDQILLWLSVLFLFICLLNTMSLLLAKFLEKAPSIGVRRALGASKTAIFTQHLSESLIVGCCGGCLGALLSYAVIATTHFQPEDRQTETIYLLMAISLSIIASLICGFFPAWKVSHTQPAKYLKSQ